MEENHLHDFDWVNPILDSDDPLDEVLMCLECGRIKATARDFYDRADNGNQGS